MKYQGYEGYVLAEQDDVVRVCIECCDDVIMVPGSMLEPVVTSSLDALKVAAIQVLQLDHDEVTSTMVAAANSAQALEAYLREHGVDDARMLDVYRAALQSIS